MKPLFVIEDEIQNKSNIFELINPQKLDPNKKTILIITYKNFAGDFDYIYGFNHKIIELLKDQYNIVFAGKEIKKNVIDIDNFYLIDMKGYASLNQNRFKRKKEDPNSNQINRNILWEEFESAFGDLEIDLIFYATPEYAILPHGKSYHKDFKEIQNEIHDYVGADTKKIQRINEIMYDIYENYDTHASILMFSAWHKNVMMNLPVFLKERNSFKVIAFSIDPANTYRYLEHHGIECTNFYFEEDKRGTRNFEKFPIAHLQHLIFENNENPTEKYSLEKTRDFFFMGTIIQEKGSRMQMWYEFLSDLKLDDKSNFWIPIKHNGIYRTKKQETSGHTKKGLQIIDEKFTDIKNAIINHPNFSGHLLPSEVKKHIVAYKYSLVLRCVSIYDSLNFRPIYYVYLNILPFLDHMYDPDYLQIPKKFQDKLAVSNSQDIEDRIKYYNQNPKERIQLLKEMREFFEIDEFLEDWKNITLKHIDHAK